MSPAQELAAQRMKNQSRIMIGIGTPRNQRAIERMVQPPFQQFDAGKTWSCAERFRGACHPAPAVEAALSCQIGR